MTECDISYYKGKDNGCYILYKTYNGTVYFYSRSARCWARSGSSLGALRCDWDSFECIGDEEVFLELL